MLSIAQLQQLFDEYAQQQALPPHPAGLYNPVRHIMSIGGKRIRPLLCLLGCQMFTHHIQNALPPALAVEFFHNFSLLHDDVMDNAPLRRGFPTVHAKYGLNAAILSGDAMLVKAYEYLSSADANLLPALIKIFNQTALEVCEGQQYDMDFETTMQVTKQQYLHMITLKTAVLLAASLQMGALTGGANHEQAKVLYRFGINIGIAFQLQDDYLDTFGKPDTFGKKIGGDILNNKKTYLLLHALENANPQQNQTLINQLSDPNANPTQKVAAITAIYEETGAKDAIQTEMERYYQLAFEYLSYLQLPDAQLFNLTHLTQQLMNRQV
ncbi:MAG TPA: polyprenyl synthetase family protein [Chitinophagales bacterium]|nr:polyprenyl synthetase family protein [Chitinophagales bacterium]HRK28629.1 polyprenyl synthetase family protein [Chitinophagales bacterium]